MEVTKQRFVSVQLTYEETRTILENYVRDHMLHNGQPLGTYKLEDYDPDCSRGKDKNNNGAFFLFLKEE